jgi:GT2 family glycosyltransferase
VVHVLPCGIQACEDWCEAALARFDDPRVAAVNPLLLDVENRRHTVSAGVTYQRWGRVRRLHKHRSSSAQVDILPDPEYATAFYRKSALEQVGPFSSAFGRSLAPVALGLALQDAGFHGVLETHSRMLVHKTRATRDSAVARGWAAERLFWRRLPAKGRSKWLAMHALLVAAQTTSGLVHPSCFLELVGRMAALAAEPFRPKARRRKKPVEQGEPLKGPHFHKTGVRRAQAQQSGSV